MAGENVEIVRRSTEAYSRGALDEPWRAGRTMPSGLVQLSRARSCRDSRADEIRAYMERFLETFEEVRIDLEDILEVDEGVVIAENLAHTRGRDGIETTAEAPG